MAGCSRDDPADETVIKKNRVSSSTSGLHELPSGLVPHRGKHYLNLQAPQIIGEVGMPKTLYVSPLAPSCTEEEIRDIFTRYSSTCRITGVRIVRNSTGRCKGYAFVDFATELEAMEAEKAVENLDTKISAKLHHPTQPLYEPLTVFVTNFPITSTADDIISRFKEKGLIVSRCELKVQRANDKEKRYAFVEFSTKEEVEAAIALNGEIGMRIVRSIPMKKKQNRCRQSRLDSPTKRLSRTVYISNLPFSVGQDELTALLEKCGKVEALKLVVNNRGKPRGFAFAEFADERDAMNFIESGNGSEILGRLISVTPSGRIITKKKLQS